MAMIRIQTGAPEAELAAELLRQEGVPAQVVSDTDSFPMGFTGAAMSYSIIVPREHEEKARRILAEVGPS